MNLVKPYYSFLRERAEEKQELYERTVRRLARAGAKDPTSQIIALAEEVDYYRNKIRALEEFIIERENKHTEAENYAT